MFDALRKGMKILVTCILLVIQLNVMFAQEYSGSISVNFFLLDECRISQSISGEINEVYRTYNRAPFLFVSYFPKESSSSQKIKSFMRDYGIEMAFYPDYDKNKTIFYGATIAPEVVVYDEKYKKVLYRGRIDNSFETVGVRRRIVTSRDLKNVLEAITTNSEIEVSESPAIGCFLN